MKYSTAEKLLQEDIEQMTQKQLQKYKVKLIDAWRYARGDYGYNNDFFVWVGELKTFTPRDFWLLKNIESKLEILGL